MKTYAIIVAAGSGIRMGGTVPKQFILVNNKPVLYYSLQTFLNAFADIQIILVLPVDYTDMGQEILDAYFDKEKIRITAGGDTRFQSVKNGLQLVEDDSIIFVHDGVRCLLTENLIHRCYASAVETGTAIPVIREFDLTKRATAVRQTNDAAPIARQLRRRVQGVAIAREACSAESATHALFRCSPLIAPVTLRTLPTGQEASCTKAIS